jgi:hypothetical protein
MFVHVSEGSVGLLNGSFAGAFQSFGQYVGVIRLLFIVVCDSNPILAGLCGEGFPF